MEEALRESEAVMIDIRTRNGSVPAYRIKGTIEEFANKRLILATEEEIAVESEIRTQGRDLLFLGEVLRCERASSEASDTETGERWAVHVNLKRTLLVI